MRAGGQDFFDRAFADQLVVVRPLRNHDRHAAALEVKRNLVNFGVVFGQLQLGLHLDMLQHGAVEQVFQAGLVVAVEVGKTQHFVRFLAKHVGVARQRDLVLRQRAGLVGTQHVHRAKVLDGVEPLDDDLSARQDHRALGQRGGDDHRQHFRRQADRHRQREQKRLGPVALGKAVDEKNNRHHDKRKANQQPADLVDADLKGVGFGGGGGGARGQRAKVGVVAGRQHHGAGRARHHVGAHEHQIGHFQCACGLRLRLGVGKFLDRQRLARHG